MLSQASPFYQIAKSLASQILDGKGFFLKLHQLFIGHKAMFANKFRATGGGCVKIRRAVGSIDCEQTRYVRNVEKRLERETPAFVRQFFI